MQSDLPVRCAIDPGVTKPQGIAVFQGSKLVYANAVLKEKLPEVIKRFGIKFAVIERMVARGNGSEKDLLNVMLSIGQISAMFDRFETVIPEHWKNGFNKQVVKTRCLKRLSAEEVALIPKGCPMDVFDAIGLGFYAFDPERSLVRRSLGL